jgi:hypothetical protein
MYILGMIGNYGAVLGLQRSNSKVNFLLTFTSYLDAITAYTPLTDTSHFYGCGYKSATKAAGAFQMQTDGTLKWFKQIVSTSDAALSSAVTVTCQGITYNPATSTVTILLATSQPTFKTDKTNSYVDAVIVEMNANGGWSRGKQITFGTSQQIPS